ncbi:hypothetical protein EMCRGX_G016843 [Ephydatia muelleri]
MSYGQQQQPPMYQGSPYQPAPAYYPPSTMQQQSNNVVVVNTQPSATSQTIIYEDEKPNHILHCIITLFCPWWILVWLCLCCMYGC